MGEEPSAAPSSNGTMNPFLVTIALGGVRLADRPRRGSSRCWLASSPSSSGFARAQSFALAADLGLDPHDKAASSKDSIETAIGWTRTGLLVWPMGSVVLCGYG